MMHLSVFVARIRGNSLRSGQTMSKAQLTLEIKQLLIETLSLDITPEQMEDDALLLGDIPEFDSMAIVSVITALEENYQFTSADDELTAEVFESVETVVSFVSEHINQ
jgi:acyl carrier protein